MRTAAISLMLSEAGVARDRLMQVSLAGTAARF
jgi:hypothetical protein